MTTPEDRSRLQSQVLKLDPADFHYGSMYPTALLRQAIPVVDLLVQLTETEIERVNPVLAEYSSDRGGQDFLFANAWNRDLAGAITDLGYAAGLRVAVGYFDGNGFQFPEQFKGMVPNLQLPPTLQRRIGERRIELNQELDEKIEAHKEQKERMKNPSKWRLVPFIGDIQDMLEQRRMKSGNQRVVVEPDFRLSISFDTDPRSYGPDFQRNTYSYHRLNHKISLVASE